MKNKDKIIKSAMTAFLAMVTAHSAMAATNDSTTTTPSSEKCYGVVKAGLNDCATATSSCAGSSTKDNQADAFVFVPQGLCDKLVGGSLTPVTKQNSNN